MECGACGDGERRTGCGGINGDNVLAETKRTSHAELWFLLQPTPPLPLPQARKSAGQCTACDAGKYKAGNNTEDCRFCAAGKFSLGKASKCTNCSLPDNADDLKCVDFSIGDATGIARQFITVTV